MTENIDFVILWVDGGDPDWQQLRAKYLSDGGEGDNGTSSNRFRDWGLMRYWFRSVEKYAPWVNRIYFVTNGQVPAWLNREHPRLKLVRHEEYIPGKYLPTFNSNVIELWMHRLPGLAEHFVLFNDDMFLTAPVEKEDFFRDGLPCDSALLDVASGPGPHDCLPHMLLNNSALLNRHFDKREVMKKNAGKFYSLQYGNDLMRNLLLTPFKYFSCFRDSHLPSSHLKSTFERVWTAEGELLEQCGNNRFRSKSDLTHWLMKCWQICEGRFAVRSTDWGRHYELWEDELTRICRDIESHRYRAVCLNDSSMDIDFERMKKRLAASFERILPKPSSYEVDLQEEISQLISSQENRSQEFVSKS